MPSRIPENQSPSSLAAFQSAGSRRRQTVEEQEGDYFQQERDRELEVERARQQQIRDKTPGLGLRSTGAKVGEIECMPNVQFFHCFK